MYCKTTTTATIKKKKRAATLVAVVPRISLKYSVRENKCGTQVLPTYDANERIAVTTLLLLYSTSKERQSTTSWNLFFLTVERPCVVSFCSTCVIPPLRRCCAPLHHGAMGWAQSKMPCAKSSKTFLHVVTHRRQQYNNKTCEKTTKRTTK